MEINTIKKLLKEFEKDLTYDQDLKKKNWFNIGGKSKIFYKANNLKELIKFLKILNNKEKIFVLGAGSNTLITDKTFNGVVIKLSSNFNNISLLKDDVIIAGSSVLDRNLADFATNSELTGFEFLSCIPGTIGGGIKMNAGCFGREFKDILISVQALDVFGNILTIPSNKINFDYRKTDIPENYIFLSASFKGIKHDKIKIQNKIKELKEQKIKAQPTKTKTSGSTFKNPISQTDKKVWQLIKESVPLDTNFGDAYISDKHCNFFVNKGQATYKDMKQLIDFVSSKVLEKTGVKLEKEIKILE